MKSKTLFWLYIYGWALYFIKDLLPFGNSLGPLLIIPLMAFSMYSVCYINKKCKIGLYIKVLNIFLFITTVYGLQPIVFHETIQLGLEGNVASYNYLLTIYISFLPIYAIYYFTLKKVVDSLRIRKVFILLVIVTLIKFISNYFSVSLLRGEDNIVNNVSYFFIPLIPLLCLTNYKKSTKIVFVTLLYIVILLGMKRGSILISTFLVVHFYVYYMAHFRRKERHKIILGIIVSLSFLLYVVYDFYANNDFLQMRIEETLEGKSSGRDMLYETYYDYFMNNTSIIQFVFGVGINSTLKLFGKYAHNDWLEMAYNQGVLGVLFLFLYFSAFLITWKKAKVKEIKLPLGYMFFTYFMVSVFSMSITNTPLAACVCIGYCIACCNNPSIVKGFEPHKC